jgi:hypothetical protein
MITGANAWPFEGRRQLEGREAYMTEVRTQLDKIRSDAAECMLLSTLVPEGKGQVFVRAAGHLNELALELEKTVSTNTAEGNAERISLSAPQAESAEEAVRADNVDQSRTPSRRMYKRTLTALVLLAGLLGVVGYLFKSKPNLPLAVSNATIEKLAALLTNEQAEREKMVGYLNELNARIDFLVSSLNDLNASRGEGAKTDNAAERGSQGSHIPAPRETSEAKNADNMLSGRGDQVGSISASQKRAEPSARKSAGPAGCTQFRSFDPVSETYTTLDGRRRECRQ